MTTLLIFRWHTGSNIWLVLDEKGFEMMRFPDCGNLARILHGLKKHRDNVVDMPILRVKEYKDKENIL